MNYSLYRGISSQRGKGAGGVQGLLCSGEMHVTGGSRKPEIPAHPWCAGVQGWETAYLPGSPIAAQPPVLILSLSFSKAHLSPAL